MRTGDFSIGDSVTSVIHYNWGDAKSIRSYLKKYDLLRRAVLVAGLYRNAGFQTRVPLGEKVMGRDILQVGELIDYVNPTYPGDSFDLDTIIHFVLNGYTITVKELDILLNVLPGICRPGRTKLKIQCNKESDHIIYQCSGKHTAHYWEICFSGHKGLCLPIKVEVTIWCDMDRPENHGDECDEECREVGSCCCESFVEKTADMTVETDWAEAEEKVKDFLNETLMI